jgi:hypothetical protein
MSESHVLKADISLLRIQAISLKSTARRLVSSQASTDNNNRGVLIELSRFQSTLYH